MEKIGIYPGTFDPFTAGHLDILQRALFVVDRLYVAIAVDSSKQTMFSVDERLEIIQNEIKCLNFDLSRIEPVAFRGLLIKFAQEKNASVIVRGIRAVSDFEYEFQMSCMNSKLSNQIQTIFLPASEKMQLVSSKLVKEVVRLGGDAYEFASEDVQNRIRNYYNQQ